MALGKNLKRKKLIEEDKETKPKSSKKKPAKKSVDVKKELIKKPKTLKKKKVVSKKTVAIKEPAQKTSKEKVDISSEQPSQPQEKQEKRLHVGLPIFIAEEIHSLKRELRERYKKQLESLRDSIVQFVVFQIGGESYAIDISVVKEIVPLQQLSKTPNTPTHIKGIANIRGNTYTVFDLAEKFKIKGDQLAKFLLVISGNDVPAALMIGSLPTTLKVNGSEITGSLDMIEDSSLDVSFIKGIIQQDEQLIYYLDIVELLKNDKAIIVPDKYLKGVDE